MKKTAVFSFFESYNIGDILIANQIKKKFSEYNQNCMYFDIGNGKPCDDCSLKENLIVKSNSTLKKKIIRTPIIGDLICSFYSLKSRAYKNVCLAAKDCDTVIFAGGNQIMELNRFPTSIIGVYRAVKELKGKGKKIGFCFCGVGPFKSFISKKIAKKIFLLADFVSVRDEYSREWVESFLSKKHIEIWCDPVLMMETQSQKTETKNAIGINTYFGHDARYKKDMHNSYNEMIKRFREEKSELTIYLFSTELTDIYDIESVKRDFYDDDKVVVKNITSEQALFEFYNEVDAVVAARMHTAITSMVYGLPILTVAWQNKVASFMQLMENSEFNFTVSEFVSNNDLVVKKLAYIIENTEDIFSKNAQRLKILKDDTNQKIKSFFSELEG